MQLARLVYAATETFPRSEQFGLTLQLRRAAVSVASNIAEGAARASSKEFSQFLSIALGSLAELDTQIELAKTLEWLPSTETLSQQRASVAKLTTKLRAAIARRVNSRSPITDHRSP